MMKRYKHLNAILLFLLMVALFPAFAFAMENMDQKVALTIFYQNETIPIVGAPFEIYQVATLDEYGEFGITEEFSKYNVEIPDKNEAAWKTLAATLEGYVLRDQMVSFDHGVTNENGVLSFPTEGKKLTQGLYLILGRRFTQDGRYFDAAPSMVILPELDAQTKASIYDVKVNPKFHSEEVPKEPTAVTRKVLKIWDDDGYEKERPQNISVQLLEDGKVCDTVILNADNNWRYSWTNLENNHSWTIVEKEMDSYSVKMTREGITFVLTNTYDGDSDIPATKETSDVSSGKKLPQTGQLWWPVPVLLCMGLLFVVLGLMFRGDGRNEK